VTGWKRSIDIYLIAAGACSFRAMHVNARIYRAVFCTACTSALSCRFPAQLIVRPIAQSHTEAALRTQWPRRVLSPPSRSLASCRISAGIPTSRPWQRLGDLLRATCARSTPHCSGYPACENGLGVPPLVRFTLTIPYQAQLAVGGTFCLPVVRIPGDPSHSYKQLCKSLDLQARTV